MKSIYKIVWTDSALAELEATIIYLAQNWTEKELHTLAIKLEQTIILLSENPNLFQVANSRRNIRRVVILKHNTIYYRIKQDQVEIISFFANRQNPKKRRIK